MAILLPLSSILLLPLLLHISKSAYANIKDLLYGRYKLTRGSYDNKSEVNRSASSPPILTSSDHAPSPQSVSRDLWILRTVDTWRKKIPH
ncbi:hypothetical protein L1987_64256 [Smallanthus sonchifolius]|uniref:Uncharacterized protein n=1 Tax=Smallanthus sonchifolius TaxID=185202 RepID=A0ACB9CFJ1_9ASTR|nr:hypothetical protein L1987_64256 [Smallanthus sonchifolius]